MTKTGKTYPGSQKVTGSFFSIRSNQPTMNIDYEYSDDLLEAIRLLEPSIKTLEEVKTFYLRFPENQPQLRFIFSAYTKECMKHCSDWDNNQPKETVEKAFEAMVAAFEFVAQVS